MVLLPLGETVGKTFLGHLGGPQLYLAWEGSDSNYTAVVSMGGGGSEQWKPSNDGRTRSRARP